MTAAFAPASPDGVSLRSDRTLHLWVLSVFAFGEPLFAALNQQFVYLHDVQAGWMEVLSVVLLLTSILPFVSVLLDQVVQRLARWWGGFGRDGVIVLLAFVVILTMLRPFLRLRFLVIESSVWMVSLGVAAPLSLLFVYLYRRSPWVRFWISVSTVGIVCSPGIFLYRYASLQRSDAQEHRIPVDRPVPVVFIVFDEFSGTTLMNRDLEVDATHFPQFARLGKTATWYRNASTVQCRTDMAVPALLSGQYPSIKRPPLESRYPGNLLQTIHRTGAYDMLVFEPITRLCPAAVRQRPSRMRTYWQKMDSVTRTLMGVYPHLILPDDMPIPFPPISRLWFGLPEVPIAEDAVTTGLVRHVPFMLRDNQVQQFLSCLRPSQQPQFCFLHVELPHLPWYFLPSGRYYNYERGAEFHPPGSWGELGEDWDEDPVVVARNEHRYLQQVGFVDRFVGQLLDQLEEIQILDQCLLIVTADHGVSFRPGHSRRVPDSETLPDILSIPLFIKWPGQTVGKIDDTNVESVDILPTIGETLGLALSEPVDGTSVTDPQRKLRKTMYVEQTMKVAQPEIPRLKEAVERRLSLFQAESWDHPPSSLASHPEWHGRELRDFPIEDRPLPSLVISPPIRSEDVGSSEFVPCLVHGTFDLHDVSTPSVELILAINGTIRDSGCSFKKGPGQLGFEFLIPETIARQSPGKVELLVAPRNSSEKRLLRRVAVSTLQPQNHSAE